MLKILKARAPFWVFIRISFTLEVQLVLGRSSSMRHWPLVDGLENTAVPSKRSLAAPRQPLTEIKVLKSLIPTPLFRSLLSLQGEVTVKSFPSLASRHTCQHLSFYTSQGGRVLHQGSIGVNFSTSTPSFPPNSSYPQEVPFKVLGNQRADVCVQR